MVIPTIVTKVQNFDIFETFVNILICRLLTPAAWKVLMHQMLLKVFFWNSQMPKPPYRL